MESMKQIITCMNDEYTIPVFKFDYSGEDDYDVEKMQGVEYILNERLRVFHDIDYGRDGKVREDKQKRVLGDNMYASILSDALMNMDLDALNACNGLDFYATYHNTRMEFIFPYGVSSPIFEISQVKPGYPKKPENMEPKELPKHVFIASIIRKGTPITVVKWYSSGFIDRY